MGINLGGLGMERVGRRGLLRSTDVERPENVTLTFCSAYRGALDRDRRALYSLFTISIFSAIDPKRRRVGALQRGDGEITRSD